MAAAVESQPVPPPALDGSVREQGHTEGVRQEQQQQRAYSETTPPAEQHQAETQQQQQHEQQHGATKDAEKDAPTHHRQSLVDDPASAFECNICLEVRSSRGGITCCPCLFSRGGVLGLARALHKHPFPRSSRLPLPLQLARDPVVTLCGHLYCWPCLFRCARSCPCAVDGETTCRLST